jgi:Holliday junction resolvase RusA-like endonuclease
MNIGFTIKLDKFPIKKNSKAIFQNRTTGQRFIASNSKAQGLINKLNAAMLAEKLRHKIETIDYDVSIAFRFYYPTKVYFTKQGKRSSKVGDLTNLIEAPQDALQKVGIIRNDSLICSLNGSIRGLSQDDNHYLRIEIEKYED